jgi:hypothetical protein
MMRRLFVALFLLCCALDGLAAPDCPPASPGRDWPLACFDTKGPVRKVKEQFVKNLRPGKNGGTRIVIEETREMVVVDAAGRVILPGVAYVGDFDFPNPDGIGRFTETTFDAGGARKRCGYFLEKNFHPLVKPQYDHCEPFLEGTAQACVGCEAYCTEPDCQGKVMVGGYGVELDRDGKLLRNVPLPGTDTVCGRNRRFSSEKLAGGVPLLHCTADAAGPGAGRR